MKSWLKFFLGKQFGQSLFKFLYLLGLKGMNFGGGSDFRDSGEEWVLKYCKKEINKKSLVVFDVGANIGGYTLLVKKILPEAKVFCFEPSKNTFHKLKENLKSQQNITYFNFAVSDTEGNLPLYTDQKFSGLASLHKREGLGLNISEDIQVNTIDNICKENNITSIDLLKLDIEGNEYKALQGAKTMLEKKQIKYIQFEFGGTDIDARIFFRDFYNLLSGNYKLFRILKNGLYPIQVYKETEEVFVTTNYLAQLK